MKKNVLLLFVLVYSSALLAQQPIFKGTIESRRNDSGFSAPFDGNHPAPLTKANFHNPSISSTHKPLYDSIKVWNLDTANGIWFINPNYRYADYVYDGNNNLLSYTMQYSDGGILLNNLKFIFQYDLDNRLIKESNMIWYDTDSSWHHGRQYSYSYDSRGNLISMLDQYWNQTYFMDISRDTYTYDTRNNMLTHLYEQCYNTTWYNYSKKTCTYDSRNNLLSEIYQQWLNATWNNHIRHAYTYNQYNNKTSALEQYWINNSWENEYRSIYTYDSANNLICDLVSQWNWSYWDTAYQTVYSYDITGNKLQELSQRWYGYWADELLDSYTYDQRYNLLTESYQFWNGGVWTNRLYRESTYDANDIKKSNVQLVWNDSGTVLISGDTTHFYYHAVIGVDELISLIDFSVYPNPATDQLYLEFKQSSSKILTVYLYDIAGKSVLPPMVIEKYAGQTRTGIPVYDIPSGSYILTISDGEHFQSRRVLIFNR